MANILSTIGTILVKNFDLDQRRLHFLSHCFALFLRVMGKFNFLQFARYHRNTYHEATYRNNFEQYFDFSTFHTDLVLTHGSGEYILALDMTYISKSGCATYGLGKYWSGCDSEAKWGFKAGILACIDIANRTALSIDAVQTPSQKEREDLGISYLSHGVDMIRWNEENLSKLSPYIVLDGYFSKKSFILPLLAKTSFHRIGTLRKDADLRYLYCGEKRKKKAGLKNKQEKSIGKNETQSIGIPSKKIRTIFCKKLYSMRYF